APRLGEERRDRRREEHLPVADPDDERALPARPDEQIRMVVVDDDEGEMALELAAGGADGLDEITGVVPLDQVCDHLRVGLGTEGVAVARERTLQLAEVLHDAVEDDGDAALLAARQRMRVE